MPKLIPPPHPGETISVSALATHLGMTPTRLNDIVCGRRGITADTAQRLSLYLGTSADFWLGLQLQYDLRVAAHSRNR